MGVFKDYSQYYNLLYKDKDYRGEAEYVISLINANCKKSKSILNLGCGTGNHDFIFSNAGFSVTGIDLSKEMIDIANSKKLIDGNLEFAQGDIRTISLNKKFDVVLSLFHVMSYQTSNGDFDSALQTANLHLQKDGLFIFDCWYGPGVLTERPAVRNKIFEDERYLINRLSTPRMHPIENCVDVDFKVHIIDKEKTLEYEIREVHKMRYFFSPEIKYFLTKNGFELIQEEEWMTRNDLTYKSWNAIFVARKK